jgi:hypothetical protein
MKTKAKSGEPALEKRQIVSVRFGRTWDRSLWAVAFSGAGEEFLCGEAWHAVRPMAYDDEPCRSLIFKTRRAARAWAKKKTIECKRHSDDWHFRAVRVRETLCPNHTTHDSARLRLLASRLL